jgi:hypothetical protein
MITGIKVSSRHIGKFVCLRYRLRRDALKPNRKTALCQSFQLTKEIMQWHNQIGV